MASDLVSLSEAAQVLGVSPERVRQLVVAGDLPGVRFGNAWAVPRVSLVVRRSQRPRRGRPFGARRAWEKIVVGDVDLDDVGRFRNRAVVHRYEVSGSDAEFLASHDAVAVSGVAAAIEMGEPLAVAARGMELYMAESFHEHLGSVVALVIDPLGDLTVRVVVDGAWDLVMGASQVADGGVRLVPRGAVALDLMGSADPRHWIAAQHLLDAHG
jgi:excisionase family DNA binding protein